MLMGSIPGLRGTVAAVGVAGNCKHGHLGRSVVKVCRHEGQTDTQYDPQNRLFGGVPPGQRAIVARSARFESARVGGAATAVLESLVVRVELL